MKVQKGARGPRTRRGLVPTPVFPVLGPRGLCHDVPCNADDRVLLYCLGGCLPRLLWSSSARQRLPHMHLLAALFHRRGASERTRCGARAGEGMKLENFVSTFLLCDRREQATWLRTGMVTGATHGVLAPPVRRCFGKIAARKATNPSLSGQEAWKVASRTLRSLRLFIQQMTGQARGLAQPRAPQLGYRTPTPLTTQTLGDAAFISAPDLSVRRNATTHKTLTERHHGNICECYGLWQTLCGWPGMAVAVGCRFEWGSSLQQPSGTSQASSERGTCDLLFTGTSASI